MNSFFLPGAIRGLGKARIKFDLAYPKFNVKKNIKFDFLKKLELIDKEFSKSSLFKTFKLFPEEDFDEVIFWTLLKLIYAEELGGICVSKTELIDFIKIKNPSLMPEKSWTTYLTNNKNNSLFYEEESMVYLTHLYKVEEIICNYLQVFFQSKPKEIFKNYKNKNLSQEQVSIINSIFDYSISFLTGGPGTGKTTMIQSILTFGIESQITPEEICLLAPTGKAAKKLGDSCRDILNSYPNLSPPMTIHRFLGYNPSSGKFKFNQENPINKKLIIIDESSMIDIFVLKAILDAYPNAKGDKRIIFVGDSDQLLSVNSGSVFSDFIELDKNVFKLSKSFRQSTEGEEIKSLAEKMCRLSDNSRLPIGDLIIQVEFKQVYSGVIFLNSQNDELALEWALNWYKNLTLKKFSGQILSPYNESKIGVRNINHFFLQDLTKGNEQKNNRPVIVNTNLYDLDLFNGDNGLFSETANSFKFINSENNEIEIPNSYLQFFDPAYAITVHKSQGSEYDHVCLIIPSEMDTPDLLLNLRILYTAITRAKKSITIIGSLILFEKAILNNDEKRLSMITRKLYPGLR